ncbi:MULTISPECIES: alpha/beta hydrolase [Pseudomonas syringae group]|uniref:alpha/beta hydrolase n=1 Tax=Pseudomonas syringae group TaxID=136849 RepID=UPI001CC20D6E|nr:alpha/beta hydrolase [Pseudomonas coronafaciens]
MLQTDSGMQNMQNVLKKYASLDTKGIEKTVLEEACQQPTIADADKSVLGDMKRDSSPNALVSGVTSLETMVQGAAETLPATVYTAEGKGPFPVVLYFHGGGWVIAGRHLYDGGALGAAAVMEKVQEAQQYAGQRLRASFAN